MTVVIVTVVIMTVVIVTVVIMTVVIVTVVRGCSQMMSCAEGGKGVGPKMIFHDEGGKGG